MNTDDRKRLSRQCADILALLRLAPRTNRELAAVALKYTSRVSDLREAGYDIECEKLDGGLTRYTLVNRRPAQLSLLGAA